MNGFLLFQRAAGIIGAKEFWLWSLPLVATTVAHSPLMPALALLTVYLLLQNRFETRITAFLGKISYSLYLVHAPIAMLQTDVARYVDPVAARVVLPAVTMGLSILVAWIFYGLVERSSINLSKRIRYRRQAAVAAPEKTPAIATTAPVEAHQPPGVHADAWLGTVDTREVIRVQPLGGSKGD
jgi:peptidoglycan/LPS O-acetylase OafA/YrhL